MTAESSPIPTIVDSLYILTFFFMCSIKPNSPTNERSHDYCDLKMPMEKNMVLTVEPGIYIKEEDFGIRLEDDVVINENGEPTNLMENIPIEIEHIEDLMNSK